MDEFTFIRDILAPLVRDTPGALGLGDDAAIITPKPGTDLVVTCDAVVGGVHFIGSEAPDLIAHKALRVNVSDLAAKGAAPVGFLLSLSLPTGAPEDWLRKFATGLVADIEAFGIPLLGGDTTSTPGPLTISVTAFGEVPTGAMTKRAGAMAGDLVCVSGSIGDGALGLLAASGRLTARLTEAHRSNLIDRYQVPQPRLALGIALRGIATAGLDISDGLVADVGHICEQSNLAADIEFARVPLSEAARAAVTADSRLIDRVLGGGDDYELALAIPPGRLPAAEEAARDADVPLTVIGTFRDGTGVKVLDRAGMEYRLRGAGYRHE